MIPSVLRQRESGEPGGGKFQDFPTPVDEGMVVLDAIHRIQANQAPDLAVRWNCKAGKCGSCSAEINGVPRLMCMTRLRQLDLAMPVIVEPMHAFPPIRDLVTDVSWNFRVKTTIKPSGLAWPMPPMAPGASNVSGACTDWTGYVEINRPNCLILNRLR